MIIECITYTLIGALWATLHHLTFHSYNTNRISIDDCRHLTLVYAFIFSIVMDKLS
jgi:hypothetical protein